MTWNKTSFILAVAMTGACAAEPDLPDQTSVQPLAQISSDEWG